MRSYTFYTRDIVSKHTGKFIEQEVYPCLVNQNLIFDFAVSKVTVELTEDQYNRATKFLRANQPYNDNWFLLGYGRKLEDLIHYLKNSETIGS